MVDVTYLIVEGNDWTPGRQCNPELMLKLDFLVTYVTAPMTTVLVITAVANIVLLTLTLRRRGEVGAKNVSQTSKKHHKATITVPCVVGVFYLSWGPILFSTLLFVNWPSFVSPVIFEFTKPLLILNAALNPMIYASRMPAFKKAFKKMVNC